NMGMQLPAVLKTLRLIYESDRKLAPFSLPPGCPPFGASPLSPPSSTPGQGFLAFRLEKLVWKHFGNAFSGECKVETCY
ncbi:hypothetical protein ABTA76_19780, partial [Acinetobacter baumannii]